MKILIVIIFLFSGLYFLKVRKDESARKALEAELTMKQVQQAVTPTPKPYKACGQQSKCYDLREYEQRCRTTRALYDCKAFVKLFQKMAPIASCTRKGSDKPIPSIWICDEDSVETSYPKLSERAVQTLSELEQPYAKQFYHSELFRGVLYSYLKDKHYQKSLEGPQE